MTTLISNDASPSVPDSTSTRGAFSLQVVQPGESEQRIALAPGKCTIGSSERCQIHLIGPTVRPLHCLIVLEGDSVSATRWAPGVLLNGQEFTTSPFREGDTLQVGEATISLLVDATAAATNTSAEPNSERQSAPNSAPPQQTADAPSLPQPSQFAGGVESRLSFPAVQPQSMTASPTPQSTQDTALLERLNNANETARARCRRMITAMRAMRSEAGSFDQRIDQLQTQLNAALQEREQIFNQLSEMQLEATDREGQTAQEVDRLISELTAAYEKATSAENALAALGQTSEELRSELQQQLVDAQGQLQLAEDALSQKAQQADQLEIELANLKGKQDQWDQIRDAGELQRTKLAQALADRERSIETLQTELAQFRQAADQADESRMEKANELASLQSELQLAQAECDQLRAAQAQATKYQTELEQTVADSEQNLEVFQLELEKFQLTSRQTEQELADNATELESLKTEFAQLKEERDQLKTKRTEYQLREQGWEHEIASRDSQIEDLSGEIAVLRTSVDEASQGAAEQGSQVDKLQQELADLTTERDQLLNAQAEQVQNLKAWEEAVESRDRRISELEEEHDGICQVLQSVEKGAFEQVDACNKLQEQLAAVRQERDQFAKAIPDQQEYAKQLEATLAERDGQITLLTEELTKTGDRQAELETQLASGTSASKTLEAEIKELSQRCEQLTQTQSTHEAEKRTLEEQLARAKADIESLHSQAQVDDEQRRELEQVAAAGSQSQESFQQELGELKARYDQLTADHQSEQENRQQLQATLTERDQALELFQVDLNSVRVELDQATKQLKSSEEERETLSRQLTGLREELAARDGEEGSDEPSMIAKLQQERDELRSQLESISSQLEDQGDRAGSGQATTATGDEEKGQLQEQLRLQEEQTQRLGTELEEARSQLATGQNELQSVTQQFEQSQSDLQRTEEALRAAEVRLSAQKDAESEPAAYPFDVSGADFSVGSEQHADDYHDAYSANVGDQETESQEPSEPGAAEASQPEAVSWQAPSEDAQQDDDQVSEDSAAAFAAGGSLLQEDPYSEAAEDYVAASSESVDDVQSESEPTAFDANFDEDPAEDTEIVMETQLEESSADFPASGSKDYDDESAATDEPAEEFQPTSFIDQYQHLLDDDNDTAFEPVQPEPAKPEPVENKLGAELDAMESGEDDSDEALQAYMSNMLRRMRGESSDEDAAPPQQTATAPINQNPNPVSAVSDVLENVTAQPVEEEVEQEGPIDLEALKRSSHKPDLPTDLAAMRELANSSARKAIAKHHKKRHLEKATGLFLVCLVSICVGGYMLLTATAAQDFLGVRFIGGSVATLVGAIGSIKLLGLLLAAIREGSVPRASKK